MSAITSRNRRMQEQAPAIVKVTSNLSIGSWLALLFNDLFQFLNNNAQAFAVIFGFINLCAYLYYQHTNRQPKKDTGQRRRRSDKR